MGGGRRRHRHRGARRVGQATVEFAFVAPLFFLCFFAAIDAALWALQTSASVSAAEQAARLPVVDQRVAQPHDKVSGHRQREPERLRLGTWRWLCQARVYCCTTSSTAAPSPVTSS